MSTVLSEEEVSDIFSVLHDGVIEYSKRFGDTLSLVVSVLYLTDRMRGAEMVHFTITGYRNPEFSAWMHEGDSKIISDFTLANLSILSAKVVDGRIRAFLSNDNPDLPYSGGTLTFDCDSYSIEAPKGIRITLDYIKEVATKYWDFLDTTTNQIVTGARRCR